MAKSCKNHTVIQSQHRIIRIACAIKTIHTCPLDFGVVVSPGKQNKEATEYDGQAYEQHRTIPNPKRGENIPPDKPNTGS